MELDEGVVRSFGTLMHLSPAAEDLLVKMTRVRDDGTCWRPHPGEPALLELERRGAVEVQCDRHGQVRQIVVLSGRIRKEVQDAVRSRRVSRRTQVVYGIRGVV